MPNKDQVEKDLREFLTKNDNLRNDDRLRYLMAIFDKHFAFNKLDHVITYNDLFNIASGAKTEFCSLPNPLMVGGRKVDSSELRTVAVVEAFIRYLNSNNLLQKLPVVDYTDDTSQYESNEE